MYAKRLALAASAVLFSSLALAQANSTWDIDPAHSGATFEILHLGVTHVRGSLHHIVGKVVWDDKDPSKDTVIADMDATTINTDEPGRDTHLKSPDFFDVAKYPTLHFQSTSAKRSRNGKLQVFGNLTLGGQTKPVTLDVHSHAPPQKGLKGGLVSALSATPTISRKDFNFGQKYGAPVLGDDVKITLDLEIDQK